MWCVCCVSTVYDVCWVVCSLHCVSLCDVWTMGIVLLCDMCVVSVSCVCCVYIFYSVFCELWCVCVCVCVIIVSHMMCTVCFVSLCAVCVVLLQFADALLWLSVGKMWTKWVESRQDSNSYISTNGARDCGSASDAAGGIAVEERKETVSLDWKLGFMQ